MSQQHIPFHQVSQEQNVFVRYQAIPQNEPKTIRSGILEHYTYKKDNGEILRRPIIQTIRNSGIITNNHKPQSSPRDTSNFSLNKNKIPIRTYMNMHRMARANMPVAPKIGNSSKAKDEVRTEHCDSTTDIVENFDMKTSSLFVSPSKQQTDGDNAQSNNWKTLKLGKNEPDSDCEIIEVTANNVSVNNNRCPVTINDNIPRNSDNDVISLVNLNEDIENLKTKVLDWIAIKPSRKSQPVIHIISDESDNDDGEYLCDKTGVKTKINKTSEKNQSSTCEAKSTSIKTERSNEQEKSNISIILQKQNISFRPDANQTIIVQKKDPLHLMKGKFYRIQTQLSRELKSSMISTPSSVNCINSNKNVSPPKTCSNAVETSLLSPKNENEKTPPSTIQKSPKFCAPLSPESMKSEFYSYLKINTNPSAQKAETIAQNRRSTRVKNLILQIERNKEQQQSNKIENDEKKEERANEVRKKFMKYSKPSVVFPSVPSNCYTHKDFDPVIEAYFHQEKIPFTTNKSHESNKKNDTTINVPKRKYKLRKRLNKKRKYIENKMKLRNKMNLQNQMLKKKRRKQLVTKMIGCTPQISDIQLRRLRFKPNRIYRDTSRRITRHSLDGNKVLPRKVIKQSKTKLNGNVNLEEKQLKINEEENTKNIAKENIESELKIRIRDINTLLPDKSKHIENDKKVMETKLTITEAKLNPLEFKLQPPEPKLTIREVAVADKPKEINTNITNSNTSTTNKITITEVKTSLNNENNSNTNVCTSNNLETQIGRVSPNNILLPNLLASKLSVALMKNLPSQKNKCKNQFFALNSLKTEQPTSSLNSCFHGFTKAEAITSSKSRALSPVCFGFEPDERSAKICKIMQEVVSNLDTDILVTSNSPIQTPEPIDHLVPEIRINSIPISNEPCNLQEVMSIMSSGLTSTQDLTPMLHNEETSSDYSEASSAQEELQMDIALGELIDPSLIEKSNSNVIPLNQNVKTKSFHRSLMQTRVKQKSFLDIYRSNVFEQSDSDSSMATPKASSCSKKSLTHGIDINSKGGAMFTTHYVNGILIIVQEFMITFWKQTALGNILGAQNMWLPNGSLQRIILERGCINRRSSEMVLSCENSVAYIELWTKQHESKFRECPIADVFATIYFHRGHGIPDKKVLQLENIKGYGHDVRFVVIKSSREIIVSWCDTFADPMKTLVRCYQLAPDFQTVCSVKEMECINHCLTSLHNIQDCDDLVLGAGNEQISVWNLRHGYLVTTLNLADSTIQSSLENKSLLLYAQCDTGFLFLIQQIEVGVLRLVAVNGMTQEWKQLQSYQVPSNYKELLGIIVESGVLMTCYTNGFLCWNMNNGQILAEIEMVDNIVLPTNKYLVAFKNYQVKVQHIMSYILTHDW